MKYLIILVFALSPLLLAAQSNDVPTGVRLTPAPNVPSIVNERFRNDYPKATATWENLEDSGYVARFKDDSTQLPKVVIYGSSGRQLETRSRLESGSYPKNIDRFYLQSDPTGKFVVWRLIKEKESTAYYGINANDTTWFDEAGRRRENSGKRNTGSGQN